MDRRSFLLVSSLLGGWTSSRALAQDPARRSTSRSLRAGEDTPRTARGRLVDDEADTPVDDRATLGAGREEADANLPAEAGQAWRTFDIVRYTELPHKESNPQNSIVEWIFRRTSTALWHGEKIAVLSASRSKVRAYHNAKILDQVSDVVDRFVDTLSDFLSIRVRFFAANDTRWRYSVYKRLNSIGSGPQGQQIWTLRNDDAALILSQMQIAQGGRLLAEQKFDMINGQTLIMKTTAPRSYTGSLQREGAVAQGFQPKTEELEEGISLRLSPLLSYEGDTLDAAIVLTSNDVRTFHPTRILAAREVGPTEARIDVPEVSETQLNQTVKGWPIGQTLLISAGIQPGLLQSKGGLFNMRIPGTTPSGTEVLMFIDVEIADDRTTRRAADRGRIRR